MNKKQKQAIPGELSESTLGYSNNPEQQQLPHVRSLKDKFKINQKKLKSRFQRYLEQHRHQYGTLQYSLNSIFQDFSEGKIPHPKKIRREKEQLSIQISQTENEFKYLSNKNKHLLKTFYKVKHKYQKIQDIRKRKKIQNQQVNRQLRQTAKEVWLQKRKSRQTIQNSKRNSFYSKLQCSRKKMNLASEVRDQSKNFRQTILHQKEQIFWQNKIKHERIKDEEDNISIKINRIHEMNKDKADELKFQKAFREIAERERVKMVSGRTKQNISNKLKLIRASTLAYESKILQYRKSLGERRFKTESTEFQDRCPNHKYQKTQAIFEPAS